MNQLASNCLTVVLFAKIPIVRYMVFPVNNSPLPMTIKTRASEKANPASKEAAGELAA